MVQKCLQFSLLAAFAAVLFTPAYGAIITDTYSGALPLTRTGTLPDQGSAFEQTFTISAPSNVTILTSSYATGGFQTNLLLFNGLGMFIAGSGPSGVPDIGTGIIGDSLLTAALASGTYTVALTDFLLGQSLTATNLSDGFGFNLGNGSTFVDANGNTRTGAYSLTISAADTSGVPEPSTLLLLLPAGLWMGYRSRKPAIH